MKPSAIIAASDSGEASDVSSPLVASEDQRMNGAASANSTPLGMPLAGTNQIVSRMSGVSSAGNSSNEEGGGGLRLNLGG